MLLGRGRRFFFIKLPCYEHNACLRKLPFHSNSGALRAWKNNPTGPKYREITMTHLAASWILQCQCCGGKGRRFRGLHPNFLAIAFLDWPLVAPVKLLSPSVDITMVALLDTGVANTTPSNPWGSLQAVKLGELIFGSVLSRYRALTDAPPQILYIDLKVLMLTFWLPTHALPSVGKNVFTPPGRKPFSTPSGIPEGMRLLIW